MDTSAILETVAQLLGVMAQMGALTGPVAGGALTGLASVANLAATLIKQGEAGAEQLAELTNELKAMVAAGRNPSEAEWLMIRKRSDAAHAIIQSGRT